VTKGLSVSLRGSGGDMQIAVDAMGGEQAPHATVEGAVMAARNHGAKVILVGDEERVYGELEKYDTSGLPLSVYHAPHEIGISPSKLLWIW
jgi:glycerol-3-phosphate acyltransferase PlsX